MRRISAIALIVTLANTSATAWWMNDIHDVPFRGEALFSNSKASDGNANLIVRKFLNQEKIEIYVATEVNLCEAPCDPLPVDVMIDGEILANRTFMSISEDGNSVFFTHPTDWLEYFNKGRKMHFRVIDKDQNEIQFEFDISGRTGFN